MSTIWEFFPVKQQNQCTSDKKIKFHKLVVILNNEKTTDRYSVPDEMV